MYIYTVVTLVTCIAVKNLLNSVQLTFIYTARSHHTYHLKALYIVKSSQVLTESETECLEIFMNDKILCFETLQSCLIFI